MNKLAYDDESDANDVPMPVAARVKNGKAILTFDGESDGLKVKGQKLKDFAVLVNGKYQWAEARIAGEDIVEVELPQGVKATTVRYCWDDYPEPSLYNSEGVPAPQFEIQAK